MNKIFYIITIGVIMSSCTSYDMNTGKKRYPAAEFVVEEVGKFVVIDKLPVPK